ncbi:serine O-acetyltransferase [bacterium]|nr:serine O-acetyltransferase [bacterium]
MLENIKKALKNGQSFWQDLKTLQERDPAAQSVWEVLLLYPGVHAVMIHRVSNFLWRKKFLFAARALSQISRNITGVEIHPGAKIGRRCFIDHGMGVVIGETAEIGDDVTLYHQVTLGGVSLNVGKRHPTLKNNVVVGAGAKVLGPIILEENVAVGAGSVVVKEVPKNSRVVGVPGRIIQRTNEEGGLKYNLEHSKLPDPIAKAIKTLFDEVHELKKLHKEISSSQKEGDSEIDFIDGSGI